MTYVTPDSLWRCCDFDLRPNHGGDSGVDSKDELDKPKVNQGGRAPVDDWTGSDLLPCEICPVECGSVQLSAAASAEGICRNPMFRLCKQAACP